MKKRIYPTIEELNESLCGKVVEKVSGKTSDYDTQAEIYSITFKDGTVIEFDTPDPPDDDYNSKATVLVAYCGGMGKSGE